MTDIAKCRGTDCPQRDTCRRYVEAPAIPTRWGSWDADRQGTLCDGYWSLRPSTQHDN